MDARLSALETVGERAVRPVPSISLVLPAFNEEESIQQAVEEAHQALCELTTDFEILVVDDGSSDRTAEIVSGLASRLGRVQLLRQPRNLGYGAALRRGFQTASKDLVAFTDADCQFDLRELDRLVLLSRHYDLACGYRIDRQDPWHRKFYSKTYNALVRLLLGTGVRDCDCALKMFRREVIQSLPFQSDNFFVNAEILSQAHLRSCSIAEVGVTHRPRLLGQSTVSLKHVLPVGRSLLRYWWREILFPQSADPSASGPGLWSAGRQAAATLLLAAACILLLMTNLSYPLIEPDETRYAQIPLTMLETGDWVTPRLDGEPYLDKPPLLYWLTAMSYAVLGTHEAAARMPCSLSALLTILAVFLLGQRLVGSRAAWCGALALMLCGGFVLCGRFILMDGPLTLFTTLVFLCAALAVRGPRLARGWWLAAAVACGLGVLTKGPVAPVLCLPPLLATRWLNRTSAPIFRRDWLLFLLPVLLINIPWFIAISQAHSEFGTYFFWKHHVLRFVKAFDHQQPWWFYLPMLVGGMFPVSLLFPLLGMFLFSRRGEERACRSESLGYLVMSAAWVCLFFSLSSCKLPTYILPALPLWSLALGVMLDQTALAGTLQGRVARLTRLVPAQAMTTTLGAGLLVLVMDLCLRNEALFGLTFDLAALLVCGGALLAVRRQRWERAVPAWACTALCAFGSVALTFSNFVPEVSQVRSIHAAANELHQTHPQAPVVYFGFKSHSAGLHLHPDEFIEFSADDDAALGHFVQSHPQAVLVASPHSQERVRELIKDSSSKLSETGRGYVQLLSHEMPESALR